MSKVVLSFLVVFLAVVVVFNVSDYWLIDFVQRLQHLNLPDPFSYIKERLVLRPVSYSGDFGADVLETLRFVGALVVTPFQAVYLFIEWLFRLVSTVFSFFPVK